MGIGWNIAVGMDFVLFLYMERGEMDWKSCIFHCPVPIFPTDDFADSWYHLTGSHRWNQVLCHS